MKFLSNNFIINGGIVSGFVLLILIIIFFRMKKQSNNCSLKWFYMAIIAYVIGMIVLISYIKHI